MIELGSVQYEETRGAFRSDFLKDEMMLSKESPNVLMQEKMTATTLILSISKTKNDLPKLDTPIKCPSDNTIYNICLHAQAYGKLINITVNMKPRHKAKVQH